MSGDGAHKEVLCYMCALRMSILFQMAPPPTLQQLRAQAGSAHGEDDLPVRDDTHHPRYTIVHETPRSVLRCVTQLCHPSPPHTSLCGATDMSEAAAAPDTAAQPCEVSWLCRACFGLYQFLDLLHAPAVAAAVRGSAYTDAKGISININVHRSLTFTWLAAAVYYCDNAHKSTGDEACSAREGEATTLPAPQSVIPEELSSFKDLYMSDLRARVLQYLLPSHEELLAMSHAATTGSQPAGLATYKALLHTSTAPQQQQAINYAGGETEHGTARTVPVRQGFVYSQNNESVIVEVNCRHTATEGLVTSGAVPPQYCSNRSDCVMSYAVIYDHVLPYLSALPGWRLFAADTEAHGASSSSSSRSGGNGETNDRRALPRQAALLTSEVTHANVFLLGHYRKLARNVSQSPWFTEGKRVGNFSLQEIIAQPILPFFFPEGVTAVPPPPLRQAAPRYEAQRRNSGRNATRDEDDAEAEETAARREPPPSWVAAQHVFGFGRYKLHSAGREDVDVRMLGAGRPFVLELVSPSREAFAAQDLRELERRIGASYEGCVEVHSLRATDAEVTVRLARHSEGKVKRYRCVVWCSRALAADALTSDPHCVAVQALRDLAIEQNTPLRVLHRRSLHPRRRLIHWIRLRRVNAHWLLVDLETQAGTYVKEFVHGDLGRTRPSLGSLLHARTDILQLDVLGMDMHELEEATAEGHAAAAEES